MIVWITLYEGEPSEYNVCHWLIHNENASSLMEHKINSKYENVLTELKTYFYCQKHLFAYFKNQ